MNPVVGLLVHWVSYQLVGSSPPRCLHLFIHVGPHLGRLQLCWLLGRVVLPLLPYFSTHSVTVPAGFAVSFVNRTASSFIFSWSILWSVRTALLSVS